MPRYERYTEPGGEDYKELVFKFKKEKEWLHTTIPVETRVTTSW